MIGELLKNAYLVDEFIGLLRARGWGNRDRLLRKLMEELGEYAEAVEYDNGSTNKVKKLKDVCTPQEKLQEEICDVAMMTFALARDAGLEVNEVLIRVWQKLAKHQKNYEKSLTEKMDGEEE